MGRLQYEPFFKFCLQMIDKDDVEVRWSDISTRCMRVIEKGTLTYIFLSTVLSDPWIQIPYLQGLRTLSSISG